MYLAACVQMRAGADIPANLERVEALAERAARWGASLVATPENTTFLGPSDQKVAIAEPLDGRTHLRLGRLAKQLRIHLLVGSVAERCDATRCYNTSLLFGPDGSLLAHYRKLHLFDIDIPGKMTFRESDTLTPGGSPTLVDTSAGRLGLGICYDLRFPELALLYARAGASLLVYPGAFNTVTGPLHWELLARARAVDAQCYVCVCSPSRVPGASYQAHGRSMVVGPFAEVVATAEAPGDVACMVTAEMEYGQVAERRRNLPLWAQRRGDLYRLVDVKEEER